MIKFICVNIVLFLFQALEKSEAHHFLVLFKEGLKFRSVYAYAPEVDLITKIYGVGPKALTPKMIHKYYK